MDKRSKIKLLDALKKEYANIGGMNKSNFMGGGSFRSTKKSSDVHTLIKSKKRDLDNKKTNFKTKNSGQPDLD